MAKNESLYITIQGTINQVPQCDSQESGSKVRLSCHHPAPDLGNYRFPFTLATSNDPQLIPIFPNRFSQQSLFFYTMQLVYRRSGNFPEVTP